MQENEKELGDEKLLILPLGEESKKITQVISNDTARQIIERLADSPLSASDIAERLQAPLTTITYNLEKLEDVGLIKVEKIKYSEKGREVKIYAPVRKLIVVVPEKTDRKSVSDIIRKYLGVILASALASGLIEFFMRRGGTEVMRITDESVKSINVQSVPAPTPAVLLNETALNETIRSADIAGNAQATTTLPAAVESVQSPAVNSAAPDIFTRMVDIISAHPGIVFLSGCLFAVVLLVIMDYRRKRKNSQTA